MLSPADSTTYFTDEIGLKKQHSFLFELKLYILFYILSNNFDLL